MLVLWFGSLEILSGDPSLLSCMLDKLCRVLELHSIQKIPAMIVHRVGTDEELLADHPAALPLRQAGDDVHLPGRRAVEQAAVALHQVGEVQLQVVPPGPLPADTVTVLDVGDVPADADGADRQAALLVHLVHRGLPEDLDVVPVRFAHAVVQAQQHFEWANERVGLDDQSCSALSDLGDAGLIVRMEVARDQFGGDVLVRVTEHFSESTVLHHLGAGVIEDVVEMVVQQG